MIEWVKNVWKECNDWKRIEKIFGGHELKKNYATRFIKIERLTEIICIIIIR